jgi:hypothetical protein
LANTKNDVAQQATRWFLTSLGERYDQVRGMAHFRPTKSQWSEVMLFFDSECAYCGLPISEAPMLKDHLIPLNRQAGGLHAWGNVVPSCRPCNDSKASADWRSWLSAHRPLDGESRIKHLEAFAGKYGYSLQADFAGAAEALYREVMSAAEALVESAVRDALASVPMENQAT